MEIKTNNTNKETLKDRIILTNKSNKIKGSVIIELVDNSEKKENKIDVIKTNKLVRA